MIVDNGTILFSNRTTTVLNGPSIENVAGGATGRIGDPSGRNSERSLLLSETIAHNLAGLQQASIYSVEI
jgi:tyrosyl-tRNA synthetase